jgi:hypothetical protein
MRTLCTHYYPQPAKEQTHILDEIVGTQRKLKEAAPSGKSAAGDSLAQSLGAGKAASTANPLITNL